MTRVHPHLSIDGSELDEFCRRWHITEMALFGSVARGDFGPTSDVDMMVDFAPGEKPSLWRFVDLRDEISSLVGRPVDLVVRGTIKNPIRRKNIERDLTVVYAA